MGAEANPTPTPTPTPTPRLGGPKSSSFRLRSSSLNALRLRRIFDVFDSNGDGAITITELRQALEQLGFDANEAEVENLVASNAKPGCSGLDYEDFEQLHQSLGDSFFGAEPEGEGGAQDGASWEQEESDLQEAFKVFDGDGDGFISARELQVVLSKLGLPEGEEIERVRQMIVSVDQNRDGQVDFHEFKDMMHNVQLLSV